MNRGRENRILRRQALSKDIRYSCLEAQLANKTKAIEDLDRRLRIAEAHPLVRTRVETVVLCVQLIVFARISFRAIPRVLHSINWPGWIPCFSSAINWICRLGLKKLIDASNHCGPWIAIVDMTLDIAFKKALVVLRVPLKIYLERKDALCLSDVSCVGMLIQSQWDGERVGLALQAIVGDGKDLKAIIRDSGSDLTKGVNLWRDRYSAEHVAVINDLGHEVANALKADFNEKIKFSELTGSIKSGATKLFQSKYAFLAPPKIRTQGRFMSISRLAKWFDKMRNVLGGPGRAKKGSLVDDVRNLFGGLGHLHYALDQLSERSLKLAEVMEILKNRGLNQETYRESMRLVESIPLRCHSRKRIRRWLRTHLALQARLSIGQTPLPISSDIIESLFGTFKNLLARNPKAEFNQLVLCIPALCGHVTESEIRESQQRISQKQMQDWVKENIGVTSMSLRRKFLKGDSFEERLPNPGKARCG